MDLKKVELKARNLRSTGTRQEVFFGNGLSLVVAARTDLKTWYFTQKIAGKNTRAKLGVYPFTTAKAAYEAMELERSRVKSAPTPELAALTKKVADSIPATVAALADRYKAEYLSGTHVGADWRRAAIGYLDRDVVPVIGKYPLKSLSRDVLLHAVNEKTKQLSEAGKRGTAANNLLAALTGMLRWGAERGYCPEGLLAGVRKPVKPRVKQRVLSEVEIGELWNLLEATKMVPRGPASQTFATVVQVLMLTGTRISEIVGPAEWHRTGLTPSDVDLKAGTLTIDDGKTEGSTRTLPMPPVLTALVEQGLRQADDPAQPIFRYGADEVVHGYRGRDRRIRQGSITRAAVRLCKALGHPKWNCHDLRRSSITTLSKLGVDGQVRRMISGHTTGRDVHEMHYDHSEKREEMLAALTKLQDYILSAADGVRQAERAKLVGGKNG